MRGREGGLRRFERRNGSETDSSAFVSRRCGSMSRRKAGFDEDFGLATAKSFSSMARYS